MSVRILIATLLLAAGLFGQCPVLLSVNPSSIPAGSPNTPVNFTGNFMQLGDQALFLPPGSQTPVPLNAAITPPNQGSATIPANLLTNSGTAQFILFRQSCSPPSSVNIQITPPQQPQCPSLSSSSPSTFTATSANVNLTLSGANLAAGDQFTMTGPGGSVQLSTTVSAATQATAVVPPNIAGVQGAYRITVSRSSCAASTAITVTITAPQQQCPSLSSSSPSAFTATNANVSLALSGNSLTGGQFFLTGPTGRVQLATTVTSATQATAVVPASVANVPGTYQIVVSSPSCGDSAPLTITIGSAQQQCPTLTSSSQSQFGAVGANVTLTLSGTNLQQGDVVTLTGSTGSVQLSTSVTGSTQATVIVPSNVASLAGVYQLTVSRPNGQCGASGPINLTITAAQQPCPSLLVSSPPSLAATGLSATLTLAGVNLLAGDLVFWTSPTGSLSLPTTVVNSSQAIVTVPGSLLQTVTLAQLTVSRPNSPCTGSTPIPLLVTSPQAACPVVSGLTPDSVLAGSPGISLTVTGSNFLTGDRVLADGGALPTVAESPRRLVAQLPANKVGLTDISISVSRPNSQCPITPPIKLVVIPLVTGLGHPASPVNRAGLDWILRLRVQRAQVHTFREITFDSPGGCDSLSGLWCGGDGGSCSGPTCVGWGDPACIGGQCGVGSCGGAYCTGQESCRMPGCDSGRCGDGFTRDCEQAPNKPFEDYNTECDKFIACGGRYHCGEGSADCDDNRCPTQYICNGGGCNGGGSCDIPQIVVHTNPPPSVGGPPNTRYAVWAPVPLLRVTALDRSASGDAYCSNIPYLDVIQPPGALVDFIQCRPGAPTAAVNTFNGNMFLAQPLISLPGQAFPLHFSIFYNSQGTTDSPLGTGWTHSFSMRLVFIPLLRNGSNIGESVVLTGADGAVYYYDSASDGSYNTHAGAPGKLTRNPDGTYRIVTLEPIVYRFDSQGNLTEIFDPKTGATQTVTSQAGNVTGVSDSNGRALQFRYTSQKLSVVADQDGNAWVQFRYNPSGQLVGVSMLDGDNWGYGYGGALLNQIITPSGATAAQVVYDDQRRVKIHVDAQGNPWVITPAVIRSPARVARPDGLETLYYYDAQGRLVRRTDPLGASTGFSYNALNNIIGVTSPLGQSISLGYDADGRPTVLSWGDSTWSMSYDSNGDPSQYTDALGRKTTYLRDSMGNLSQLTLPDGATRRYSYDAKGRLVAQIDPLRVTSNYQYDARGNLVRMATDGSTTVYSYEYDTFGRIIRRTATDQTGALRVTAFDYKANGSGLLKQIAFAPGTSSETIFSYQYDADGNLVRKTGPADRITAFAYDELNRPIRITEAAGTADERSTSLLYLGYGQPIVVVDPLGAQTQFTYDAAGRLVRRDAPLTTYSYDSAGRLVTRTDANGNTTAFDYDVFNHVIRTGLADGSSLLYTYDAVGNRISMTDPRGATIYSYDARDRLVKQIGPDGATLQFGYDLNSNRISLTYPDGSAALYTYDGLSRLVRATDGSGAATTYTYDGLGRVTSVSPPSGTTVNYSYDPLGRVVSVSNGSLPSFTYEYDARGRLVRRVSGPGADIYAYDSLDRVISWTPPSGDKTTYTYDALGSRLSVSGPSGTVQYTYDSLSRMLTAGDVILIYDDAGNLTGDGSRQYVWDSLRRLVSAGGLVIQYDGLGRRVSQETPSGTYRYLVDPITGQVLVESGPDGDLTYSYGRGRVSLDSPSGKLLYYYDGQGNVVALTDTSGAVLEQNSYDPFGVKLNPDSATDPNKYHFQGAATDPATGLIYIGGRYYSPLWGRFLTRPY